MDISHRPLAYLANICDTMPEDRLTMLLETLKADQTFREKLQDAADLDPALKIASDAEFTVTEAK